MLEAQKQQNLRGLRRDLNRAVAALKSGARVVCRSGWGDGTCFTHPWLEDRAAPLPLEEEDLFLLFPRIETGQEPPWENLLDDGLKEALQYFWPGPLHLRVRLAGASTRLLLATPWHPLMQELLARHGPLFWAPLTEEGAPGSEEGGGDGERRLRWPEKEVAITPTVLDLTTRPWRLTRAGFVSYDELRARVRQPIVLSQERAFPVRPIRTYVPEGTTLILEAERLEQLPGAIESLRGQVPADCSLRIYLDESTAHSHFPDDREVRVYGELSDLERVRRRLQAMLERQNRRLGKRISLIAVAGLGPGSESFKTDLRKLSDGWLQVVDGAELTLPT